MNSPIDAIPNIIRLKQEHAELLEALVDLENAARGMPNSHDNLCQSTLNLACEFARDIIEKIEEEN